MSIGCNSDIKFQNDNPASILWQLYAGLHPYEAMMGYVIKASDGSVIVIDGGNKVDAIQLSELIKELGGVVNAWFITHPHSDHIDALVEIVNNHDDIWIRQIYAAC